MAIQKDPRPKGGQTIHPGRKGAFSWSKCPKQEKKGRQVIKEFFQRTLKSNGVPSGIVTIQTHGNMLNIHPHTHVIVSDGLFCEDSTFHLMPPIDNRGRASPHLPAPRRGRQVRAG